jgi:hypothetical protein
MTVDPIDVLVSYAHENGEVLQAIGLVERLRRSRTPTGGRARVWLDVQPGDIAPGTGFYREIAVAISRSAAIVPIYSSAYFASRDCEWELEKAFQARMQGTTRLVPLLIEEQAREKIPFYVDHLQYVLLNSRQDWFGLLLDRIGLLPASEGDTLRLEFLTQPPGSVVVNHTLSPIRVAVRSGDGIDGQEAEAVTIRVEVGRLNGTTTRPADGGVAEFTDLSVASSVRSTRLVATCEAFGAEASSQPFTVREAGPARTTSLRADTDVTRARGGTASFLGDTGALAVLLSDGAEIVDSGGATTATTRFEMEPRLIRRAGSTIALATWTGSVHVGGTERAFATWPLGDRGAFAVPGDLAIAGEHVYVGFWDGSVYRLTCGGDRPPELALIHEAGVQALAVVGARLYLCDLTGRLCVYAGEQVAWSRRLEPVIWLLKPYQRALVAVGDRMLYHLPLDGAPPFEEPLPLGRIAGVFGDTDVPVVVDVHGKGIRFDENLEFRQGFQSVAGALPSSADLRGRWCVLADRDGTHSLVEDSRVVLTHRGGTLAISPGGDRLAVEDEHGLRVVPPDELRNR